MAAVDPTAPPTLRIARPDEQYGDGTGASLPLRGETETQLHQTTVDSVVHALRILAQQQGSTTQIPICPGQSLQSLVDIINREWRSLNFPYDILPQPTLNYCLANSPSQLRTESGQLLVVRANLCAVTTHSATYPEQIQALQRDGMSVADPTSTAVVLAALILAAHKTESDRWKEHFCGTHFRAQVFDGVSGQEYPGKSIRISFSHDQGIVADVESQVGASPSANYKDASIWCAGTDSRSTTLNWVQRTERWLFRRGQ
jgi:hypothetical protein